MATEEKEPETTGRLIGADRQRLLIIGARGFLGTYAVEAALNAEGFHLIRGDRSRSTTGVASAAATERESVEIDIADIASVDKAFAKVRPDSVLLLAAVSDIDRCEAAPEMAFAINAYGAEHVANACARSHARLLFTSSAAVFDGSKNGYREEDPPAPVSVYGKSKLWAEQSVLKHLPTALVIRFALVLGFARRHGTNAMLNTLVDKWKAGETVAMSTQEERNPIDAATLSRVMLHLIANQDLSGIYHTGASDSLSRFELGLRLAARAGISAELVKPQYEAAPGRAPRGRNHFLLTDKLRGICNIETGSCDQVIERCFA
jgi:dTDP-4-dehydrorhamnose reductase